MSSRCFSIGLSVVLYSVALAGEPQSALLGKVQSLLTPAAKKISHPVVVRVRQDAFATSAERVDLQRPVHRMILGTPVYGTSRTIGSLTVAPLPDDDSAVINVHFQGRVYINTVGVQDPVRVYSRSFTDFAVTRQVTFSPEGGFKAVDSGYRGRTQLVIDDVRSTSPGLRGRIARRIGWRRASESRAIAERIAWQQTRDDVCLGFDDKVAVRLAELNRQIDFPKYARNVLGDLKGLDIKSCSSQDCIQFALGKKGEEATPLVAFDKGPGTPVEVWVHTSLLGSQLVPSAMESWMPFAMPASPLTAAIPLLQAIGSAEDEATSTPIRLQKDWLVIGMDPNAETPAPKRHVVAKPPLPKSSY